MASVVSNVQYDSPVGYAEEIFTIQFGSTTSQTVTPTTIQAISDFTIEPINSTAATNITSTYANGFVYGAATLVIASANNCNFLVKIRGTRT